MKSYKRIFQEAKQVGVLYHFTIPRFAISIIHDNLTLTSHRKFISFTRNFKLQSPTSFEINTIRFAIDGDKLSQKYKIEPINALLQRNNEENEERINNQFVSIKDSLIQIDILNDNRYNIQWLLKKLLLENDKLKINIVNSWKPVRI